MYAHVYLQMPGMTERQDFNHRCVSCGKMMHCVTSDATHHDACKPRSCPGRCGTLIHGPATLCVTCNQRCVVEEAIRKAQMVKILDDLRSLVDSEYDKESLNTATHFICPACFESLEQNASLTRLHRAGYFPTFEHGSKARYEIVCDRDFEANYFAGHALVKHLICK